VKSPIQSLWIGTSLSTLEKLSIQSFMDHGHAFHLYAYQNLPDRPAGAVLRDANDILPSSQIFQYRDRKSFAAFSNVFRYKLLLERGGWWADTDVVCLRPLDLADEHVFVSETVEWRGATGPQTVVASCLIKAPSGSPAMALALSRCLAKDRATLRWGEIGPRLVGEAVEANGLQRFVRPPAAFCPIGYGAWRQLIDATPPSLPSEAYAVHFWNEMWRLAGLDRDAEYPASSLYERLKDRHLRRTDRALPAAFADDDGWRGDIRR
jgi:Glycosyltransferase sugar-binding region containing DXD motif/Alpha 1,4-glycosyltransferase conserved region